MDPHRAEELRSLAYHREVAGRMLRDEEILHRARRRVQGWVQAPETFPGSPEWAKRWAEVLDRPAPEIAELITADDERGRGLRQSNPFAGAIGPAERNRIRRAAVGGEEGPAAREAG